MVVYGYDSLLSASRWPLIKHILSVLTKLSPVVHEEGESGTANVAVFADEVGIYVYMYICACVFVFTLV